MRYLKGRISSVQTLISSLALCGMTLTAATPITAFAALDELVTTTARGRSEAIKDVPATVAVINQDSIEALGIERVEDFINLVPGVTIVDAAEVGDTQINIRGINGARDAENSIALVIDGVLMTNPAAVNREYTNLQQIDIVKGPQGAIYGRNASAGAIIITTQQPGDEFEVRLKGSVAEDETYTMMGNLTGPLGDSLGWSLGADYRTTDGFYSNRECVDAANVDCSDPANIRSTDGVIDSFEGWNVDGRLVWEVTDTWAIDFKGRYGEVDANSITFNSNFHLPNLVGGLGPAANEDVNEHPMRFNTNIVSNNDQEATELSFRSTTELDIGELAIWGLYSDIQNSLGADGTSAAFGFFNANALCQQSTADNTGFPVNPPQFIGQNPNLAGPGNPNGSLLGAYTPTTCDGTQFQVRDQKDYSLEIRLTSNADQALRWSAGLYYLNIDRQVGVNTGLDTGTGITQSLFVDNNLTPAGSPGAVNNPTEQLINDQFDSDVYAVFGSLDWDILDSLTAGFALRYDREERDARSLVSTTARTEYIDTCGDGGGAFTDPINPGLCAGPFTPRDETYDQWQPKLSLKWDALDNLSLFTSIGVGFKSGGFNGQGSQATVDSFINSIPSIQAGTYSSVDITDEYQEETSTSFELGAKGRIGSSFSYEAAFYHIEVDDMQFFEFIVGPFGLLRVVENVDEVTIDGIEISGIWSPTDWLNLFAGANWIDSEIDKNSVRPDTVGNDAPYTAEWTANLGGDVLIPLTEKLNLIGSMDLTGIGDTWFHVVQGQNRPTGFEFLFGEAAATANYSTAKRDAYWLLNARLGLGGENWSVVAFGRNITDEDWLQEVIPAPEFGGSFIHPGSRSRYGIEGTIRF